ncbi:hypothetical protein OSJ97_25795, partial [Escherichia coli]|nr:hypothetical protein [Escherichia coli]
MEQPFNLFSVLKDTFKREKETTIYNRKKYEIGINKHTFSSTLGNRLISPFDINSEKQLNDLISILQSYY